MIVQYDSDDAFRRILRIKVGQLPNEFNAAVAVFHARRDVPILEVQRCQDGTGAQSLVFVIAADWGCLPGTGGRSGAVLLMAWTPGFSSSETVMMLEVVNRKHNY